MVTPAVGRIDEPSQTPPSQVPVEDREWAKLLWEEWKYRHEAFWNKLYRSVWAVIVCAAVPWVKVWGVEFFAEVRKNYPAFRWGYGIFLLLFFWGTAVLLSSEHLKLKALGHRIKCLRGPYNPEKWTLRQEFRKYKMVKGAAITYCALGTLILLVYALYFGRH